MIRGADGRSRCWWAGADGDFRAYHDEEWGRPVTSDRELYEHLCLEAFQSGLSWLTILRKREAFRAAFAGFDPAAVAEFGDADTTRLLADAAIIRNRAKIGATIANARAVVVMKRDGESLAELIWSHRPRRRRAPRSRSEIAAPTAESAALARALKARGFVFVGPTIAYALMQACGIVNDHMARCAVRRAVEEERRVALATFA